MKLTAWMAAALVCISLGTTVLRASDDSKKTNSGPERIGVYDSRAIAYADFWSDAHQAKLKDMSKAAKEARAAGQAERARELEMALKKEQEQSHLRVFSTAPVDDVLAGMKDRVEAVKKETGVSRLVSKWDEATLKTLKPAEQVDVSDALLRGFKLDEKQQKVVEEMQKKKPLPLEKAQKLMDEGKL